MAEHVATIDVSLARVETQVFRISADVAELKQEVRGDFAELRADIKGNAAALGDVMRDVRNRVDRLGDSLASAKVWALFIAAALLGILARGFHWL